MKDDSCRLCGGVTTEFLECGGREFQDCPGCAAVQVHSRHLPSFEFERDHYGLHQNDVDDPEYRAYFSRLVKPLLERLRPGAIGLDYGCGPGPALAAVLEEAGHPVALYDPLFAPDTSVLHKKYDFVTCTETAEHFHKPGEEFERLAGLLAPGGILAVMTLFNPGRDAFPGWHYRRDPTHVVFYVEKTFRWLADTHDLVVDYVAGSVALLRRG